EIDAALAKLETGLAGDVPSDLFWSLRMRTSARNALRGTIARITPGAVNSEVALTLADGVAIVATVTPARRDERGLTIGKPARALIKSSFVLLAKGEGLRTSARDQLAGTIAAREDGAVNSEIRLDLGAGKTLVASITLESANALELAVGEKVTALIKAP